MRTKIEPLSHLQLDTEAEQTRLREDGTDRKITTATNDQVYAEFVIFAVGWLHRPKS